METRLNVLQQVRVATPCTYSWERMEGDDRVRHCPECNLNVYNFEAMTAAEVVQLIQEKEGRLCGRLYRRRDGTIITRDCPVGVAAAMRRSAVKIAGRVAAALVAAAGALACGMRIGDSARPPANESVAQVEPFRTLGRWMKRSRAQSIPVAGIIMPVRPPGTGPGPSAPNPPNGQSPVAPRGEN